MEEDYINGLENSQICIKVNLWKEKGTEEEHFGGLMEAGIKANLEMESKADMEFCIVMEDMLNMKDLGIMECLMEKGHSFLRMDKSMKGLSNKINFTEMVYSLKMIPSFMEFGKIMSYLL